MWKPIPNFEGYYEASYYGEIRSVDRNVFNPLNKINKRKGTVLRGAPNRSGYLTVMLSKNGKYYTKILHRLVAITFIDNPDTLPQVNHINGNKLDNSVPNLEWCSNRHNFDHAVKMGLYVKSHQRLKDARRPVIIHNGVNESISFGSGKSAASHLKTSSGAIGNVLNGTRKTIKGYFVEYV